MNVPGEVVPSLSFSARYATMAFLLGPLKYPNVEMPNTGRKNFFSAPCKEHEQNTLEDQTIKNKREHLFLQYCAPIQHPNAEI